MEPDPSWWELLFTFLLVGIIAVAQMSLIVLPLVGAGIWTVSRVRRRRNRGR